MKIFRRKKDGKLYTIAHIRAPKYTGSWYNALPYKWEGKLLKDIRMTDFELVSEGSYKPPPPLPEFP